MELGVRRIRTAGRGSGSIEVTLPSSLRTLVGLPCRVTLRDGARPDIVLQPDLRDAHAAFVAIWHGMTATVLRGVADMPAFPVASFGFGLQPRDGSAETPFLCWHDGLALAERAPHPPHAVARVVAALSQALAVELAVAPGLAQEFGAACGFLVAGVAPSLEAQEVCDRVAAMLPGGRRTGVPGDTKDEAFWAGIGPQVLAAAGLFRSWAPAQGAAA